MAGVTVAVVGAYVCGFFAFFLGDMLGRSVARICISFSSWLWLGTRVADSDGFGSTGRMHTCGSEGDMGGRMENFVFHRSRSLRLVYFVGLLN